VARRIRLTTWYLRKVASVVSPAARRADAVGRTIRALAAQNDLPGATDYEAEMKPIGRAWVRRISDRNLWLWYRFNDEELTLIAVTTEPLVPIDA